jgi:predicted phosphohydrolase
MSEQLIGQFNKRQARQISEPEFKRLCGEVWAESVMELNGPLEQQHVPMDKECALLKAVLVRLRHKLDQDADDSEHGFMFAQDQSALYRNEISRIMRQSAAAPFDYNRVINRLLREIITGETV